MNERILAVKAVLENCFTAQEYFTKFWHSHEPAAPEKPEDHSVESLRDLVLREHFFNYSLWHHEDIARKSDVNDSIIADCKRKIDKLNQQRNDCIEEVDKCLVSIIEKQIPKNATSRQNTETVGMAIDRLSILALKIYHMEEQTRRRDVNKAHIQACTEKLAILQRQRSDLMRAVLELVSDYGMGVKVPVLYSQFKMYNDPSLNPELYATRGA